MAARRLATRIPILLLPAKQMRLPLWERRSHSCGPAERQRFFGSPGKMLLAASVACRRDFFLTGASKQSAMKKQRTPPASCLEIERTGAGGQ